MPSRGAIDRSSRKKVAIVGSGSAGIAALWALNRTYHDVYLFEASDRLGGQIKTVQWKSGKYTTAVDAGFAVFNSETSPNFMGFLDKMGVETEPSRMTLGVSRDHGSFGWAGSSLGAMFSRKRNVLSPKLWRMVFDIARFNHFALDLLMGEDDDTRSNGLGMVNHVGKASTIGEYLADEGYSDTFRDDYLLPMIAALWRITVDKSALEFPAEELVRSLWNHNLLSSLAGRGKWLTLKDGASSYIDAVLKGFPPNHFYLKTPVRQVLSGGSGLVKVCLENDRHEMFDHVILAVHGDQALSLINASATQEERSILSCFQTSQNEAILHSDLSLMPRKQDVWASMNYLSVSTHHRGKASVAQASITYNLNMLQQIPRRPFGDVLVTINPMHRPRTGRMQGRYYYSNPLYTVAAAQARKDLSMIQNKRGISYAGAWTRSGLHEDGISSGFYVAQQHLGARIPFGSNDMTSGRGRTPKISLTDHFLRLVILFIQVFVVQVLERLAASARLRNKPMINGVNVGILSRKRA